MFEYEREKLFLNKIEYYFYVTDPMSKIMFKYNVFMYNKFKLK